MLFSPDTCDFREIPGEEDSGSCGAKLDFVSNGRELVRSSLAVEAFVPNINEDILDNTPLAVGEDDFLVEPDVEVSSSDREGTIDDLARVQNPCCPAWELIDLRNDDNGGSCVGVDMEASRLRDGMFDGS